MATSEAEVAQLTLRQLNAQIAYAVWRFQYIGKSSLRKDAFKRLLWLEAQREKLHGIPAPRRRRA
jgi:hypothetical protein